MELADVTEMARSVRARSARAVAVDWRAKAAPKNVVAIASAILCCSVWLSREGACSAHAGRGGNPEKLGPKLRSLGASLFTVGVGGPDYDLSGLRDWIAWRDSQNS